MGAAKSGKVPVNSAQRTDLGDENGTSRDAWHEAGRRPKEEASDRKWKRNKVGHERSLLNNLKTESKFRR